MYKGTQTRISNTCARLYSSMCCALVWSLYSFYMKWSVAVLNQPHVILHIKVTSNHLFPVDMRVIDHVQPPITMTKR